MHPLFVIRSSTASEKLDDAGFSNVGMLTAGLQKVPIGTEPLFPPSPTPHPPPSLSGIH